MSVTSLKDYSYSNKTNSININNTSNIPRKISFTSNQQNDDALEIHNAKVNAALWTSLFHVYSTIYYAIKKPNLENVDIQNKEKETLKQYKIKHEQTRASAISVLIGTAGCIAGYIVALPLAMAIKKNKVLMASLPLLTFFGAKLGYAGYLASKKPETSKTEF